MDPHGPYVNIHGPFLVPVKLCLPDGCWLFVYAMADSGADCCFIDMAFMKQHRIPVQDKETPTLVESIDGHLLRSSPVTQETHPVILQVQHHQEQLQFNVARMPCFPLILELSWLQTHNLLMAWA